MTCMVFIAGTSVSPHLRLAFSYMAGLRWERDSAAKRHFVYRAADDESNCRFGSYERPNQPALFPFANSFAPSIKVIRVFCAAPHLEFSIGGSQPPGKEYTHNLPLGYESFPSRPLKSRRKDSLARDFCW